MKSKTILLIAAHRPDRSPSQRFRFEQYLAFLNENGYDYTFSAIINEKDDKILYGSGGLLSKLWIVLKAVIKRFQDVTRAHKYDAIFIQREAFMLGTSVFEYLLSRRNENLIFDFDDALWKLDTSAGNQSLEWLKSDTKVNRIIGYSKLVLAGNPYLAEYAKKFNPNTVVFPTTIDLNYHQVEASTGNSDRICIGWTGSLTTIKHFSLIETALLELKEKYGARIYFKVIGDENYRNEKLGIEGLPWRAATEIHDLSEINIGIMPLPDDEWANGKCAFKGLQYMALKIPTVMSPVGMNKDLIEDGTNGFLAATTDEWVNTISQLIEQPETRNKVGEAAYLTIEKQYSSQALSTKYLELFQSVTG